MIKKSYWYTWLDGLEGLDVTGAGLVQADAAVQKALQMRWK